MLNSDVPNTTYDPCSLAGACLYMQWTVHRRWKSYSRDGFNGHKHHYSLPTRLTPFQTDLNACTNVSADPGTPRKCCVISNVYQGSGICHMTGMAIGQLCYKSASHRLCVMLQRWAVVQCRSMRSRSIKWRTIMALPGAWQVRCHDSRYNAPP